MMHAMSTKVLSVALVLLVLEGWLSVSAALAETIRLADLQADEVIVATVRSWGCFDYRAKYELRFSPDPRESGGVVVRVKRLRGLWHRNLGGRSLDASELRGLDAGMDAYRKQQSVCVSTTLHEIRLKLVHDGEVVAEEMHRGHSCDVAAIPGALDLSELPIEFDGHRPRAQTDASVRPNNRLKLPARGRSAADARLCTRAAA